MSNFVVSARKYRPQRFDSVVGQEHVSQTLKNALQNDQLAHAFLFCGPRGVGKTTCARILAKVLNCQNLTEDYEACNECPSCKAFNDNASFNITELDAASNNSVEHIRALIEQVRFQPQQGKYKVFIIDEVHMLSQQAFNAFLKTLEEPPPYAIFILATTEKHKIIPTILSRCQIFDFRRIQVPAMIDHLQAICQEEQIDADRDALHIIAQKADGALRDALSIFDRMHSSSGKKITYDDVITNLNVLDYDYFFKIIDAFLIEDLSTVLLTFDDIQRKGFEADLFINGLAEHLRNLLVYKDPKTHTLLEVSDVLKGRYAQQATNSPAAFLLSCLSIANDCDVEYRMARNKRLHVEMALIKMVYINRALAGGELPSPAGSAPLEKKTADASAAPVKPSPPAAPVQPPPASVASTPVNEPPAPPVAPPAAPQESAPPAPAPAPTANKLQLGGGKKNSLFSLDAIDEAVVKEQKQQGQDTVELNLDEVKKSWLKYAERLTSPARKDTMVKAELQLQEQEITVVVARKMGKELIQQEKELMSFMRQQLSSPHLTMKCIIDPSKQIEAPTKPKVLTPKEIYDEMRQSNSMIEEMRKRFDLGIDH
ncbi:MAG: DNA polymerase III subunit gamma/tau [Bacteroidota bacterium]